MEVSSDGSSTASTSSSCSIDIGLVSVSLACLFAVVGRKDLSRALNDDTVCSMIEESTRQLVSTQLSYSREVCTSEIITGGLDQILKGLNGLLLQIGCGGNFKSGMCYY
jgi:hypothetical protein